MSGVPISLLWIQYGRYCDLQLRDDGWPLRFEDWLIEEQRLAGDQLTLDGDELGRGANP